MVENKKVLLCVPVVRLGHSNFINYQDASGMENLGIEYAGAALKTVGADIKIAVFSSESVLIDIIKDFKPRLVGFTSLTYQSPLVARVIKEIKKQFPWILVVAGGDHASAKPEDFLNAGADYVVKGEGEKAVREIYKGEIDESRKIVESPLLDTEDLNNIFPLRVPGWGLKKNLRPIWSALFEREGVAYCIISRRGCGRSCDFCNSGEMWKRKVRLRSIESVEKELIDISSLNDACGICFADLDFFVPVSFAEIIVDLIIEMKKSGKIRKDLKFICLGSFPPLEKSEKIFSKMFEAGFVEVSFGIEVVEERQRKILNKRKSNWMDIVSLAANSGIATRAFLMLGYPTQDEDYYQEFLRVVSSKEFVEVFDTIRLSLCTPLPGTRLWQHCKEKELFLPNFDPDSIEHYGRITTDEQIIKAEVNLKEIREIAIKNFYFSEHYLNCDRTKKFSWIKKAREAMVETMNT